MREQSRHAPLAFPKRASQAKVLAWRTLQRLWRALHARDSVKFHLILRSNASYAAGMLHGAMHRFILPIAILQAHYLSSVSYLPVLQLQQGYCLLEKQTHRVPLVYRHLQLQYTLALHSH